MKPREFWIDANNTALPYPTDTNEFHVREVVEISEAEIAHAKAMCKFHNSTDKVSDYLIDESFEAGARWALRKVKGEE